MYEATQGDPSGPVDAGSAAPSALVLLADIVHSRDLTPDERERAQRRITELSQGGAAFRFTGGDEFEWRLRDEPAALDAVLLLRARLAAPMAGSPSILLRCGLGRGPLTVHSRQGPYAEDGPAYHRARAAMEAIRVSSKRRYRSSSQPFKPAGHAPRLTAFVGASDNPLCDALLAHMDAILNAWSPPQWAAVACTLEGLRYAEASERLGVSLQAVHKRLQSARLDLYLQGHEALKQAWAAL